MATSKLAMPVLKTTRNLEYTNIITKIPELKKVTHSDYCLLPCEAEYSLVVIYENPFDLLGIIYGIEDLHQKVLLHIKQKQEILLRGKQIILELKETRLGTLDSTHDDEESTCR